MNVLMKFLSSGTNESSKRLAGLSCIAALIINSFLWHTEILFYCLTLTGLMCLGLTTIEMIYELLMLIRGVKSETKIVKEESSSETITKN